MTPESWLPFYKTGEVKFYGKLRDIHTSFSVRFEHHMLKNIQYFDRSIRNPSVLVPRSSSGVWDQGEMLVVSYTRFHFDSCSPQDTAVYFLIA